MDKRRNVALALAVGLGAFAWTGSALGAGDGLRGVWTAERSRWKLSPSAR